MVRPKNVNANLNKVKSLFYFVREDFGCTAEPITALIIGVSD